MNEVVEAAALDNWNFIRVMVGDEPYLALLDTLEQLYRSRVHDFWTNIVIACEK